MKNIFKIILYSNLLIIFLGTQASYCAPQKLYAAELNGSTANSPAIISDNCYISKIRNKKIGYFCTTQMKENNKVITIKNIKRSLNRFGYDIDTIKEYTYIETIDGKALELKAKIIYPGEKTEIEAIFTPNDTIAITQKSNNSETTKEIPLESKILFPYAIQQLIRNTQVDNFNYFTVDPMNDFRTINVEYNKVSQEQHNELNDKPLNKYKITVDLIPNLGNYEWYDTEGKLYKKYSSVLNTEEQLIPKDLLEICEDKSNIFFRNLIPVDTYIKNPERIDNITYKITMSSPNIASNILFLSDDRQRLIQSNENITYLKVFKEKSDKEFPYPTNTNGYDELLRSNNIIEPDNDLIKNTAKSISKTQTNTQSVAKALEHWTYENIKQDIASNDINNASSILNKKAGNSIEHSVILTSLLRAAGIPSKIVLGLIYTNTPENSFSYHSWVKANIGEWINLDSYYPSETFTPVHIAMYETSLDKEADKDFITNKLTKEISCTQISILNYNMEQKETNNIPPTQLVKNNENIKIITLQNAKSQSNQIKNIDFGTKQLENINNIKNIKLKNHTKEELIRLGFYNYTEGDIETAIENFKKAYELIPHSTDFTDLQFAKKLSAIGLFELSQKIIDNIQNKALWQKQTESIEKIQFPIIFPTGNNEIIYSKALSLIKFQNKPDEAIKIVQETPGATLGISDYANFLIAKAYYEKQDYLSAKNFINRSISINNKNLNYKLLKAKILNKNNESKDAIKIIIQISKNDIYDETFLEDVESEQYFALSQILKQDNLKKYYLAKYYTTTSQTSKALEILHNEIKSDTKLGQIYSLAANIEIEQNNTNLALDHIQTALKLNKKDSLAYELSGFIEQHTGNTETALDLYKKSHKYSKDKSELSVKIGQLQEDNNDIKKAIESYKKAIKENPKNYLALYMLGKITYDFGNKDEAIIYLEESIALNPLYTKPWAQLTLIEINDNNHFLARDYLIPIKFIDDNNPDYYYLSGLIALRNDNKTKAINFFEKALSVDPDHKQSRFELNQLTND